jgi:glutaminyl-peptide cyclotransferase
MELARIVLLAGLTLLARCNGEPRNVTRQASATAPGTPVLGYEVVRTYPHDPKAYTQGLVYQDGFLYESTGLHGQSSLRKVELETGAVIKEVDLAPQFFGEGLALYKGRMFQLTWHSKVGFIYDLGSFNRIGNFSYPGEGWGLTHDGSWLIMSDGTDKLRYLDPETQKTQHDLRVKNGNQPLVALNELEFIKGRIYANVYQTDRIARIEPDSGRVACWIDLSGLLKPEDRKKSVDVLNGIAYDAGRDRIFVTGKLWPKLFEIRVKEN